MPAVGGAVGQHPDGIPVDAQPARVRLDRDALPGAVAEAPVQRRHRPQQRQRQQRNPLFELLHHLLHTGALGQQVVDQKGRLHRAEGSTFPPLPLIAGKFPVIQLPAHQALLVDSLVEDRNSLRKHQPCAQRGIGGPLPHFRHQRSVFFDGADCVLRPGGQIGRRAALRHPVKIHVAGPQHPPVLRLPLHRAASGGAGEHPFPVLLLHALAFLRFVLMGPL